MRAGDGMGNRRGKRFIWQEHIKETFDQSELWWLRWRRGWGASCEKSQSVGGSESMGLWRWSSLAVCVVPATWATWGTFETQSVAEGNTRKGDNGKEIIVWTNTIATWRFFFFSFFTVDESQANRPPPAQPRAATVKTPDGSWSLDCHCTRCSSTYKAWQASNKATS